MWRNTVRWQYRCTICYFGLCAYIRSFGNVCCRLLIQIALVIVSLLWYWARKLLQGHGLHKMVDCLICFLNFLHPHDISVFDWPILVSLQKPTIQPGLSQCILGLSSYLFHSVQHFCWEQGFSAKWCPMEWSCGSLGAFLEFCISPSSPGSVNIAILQRNSACSLHWQLISWQNGWLGRVTWLLKVRNEVGETHEEAEDLKIAIMWDKLEAAFLSQLSRKRGIPWSSFFSNKNILDFSHFENFESCQVKAWALWESERGSKRETESRDSNS